MYITINEHNIPINTVKDGDKLSLSLYGVQDIADVFTAFQPDSMPVITIYDEDHNGRTMEVYSSHRVLGFHAVEQGCIQVDLQVDPLDVGKAVELTEELEEQKENAIANDYVIDEILALLASHEERLAALEPSETDDIEDEGGIVE